MPDIDKKITCQEIFMLALSVKCNLQWIRTSPFLDIEIKNNDTGKETWVYR